MDHMGSQLAGMLMQSPVYEMYSQVAPRVEDFPVLLDKMGELLRQDYDWSAEVPKITAPVMLVYADADAVRPAHIVEFYALLGGGLRDANWDGSLRPVARLAVLPGHTHYDIFRSADLPAAVMPFLDAPSLDRRPRWAGDLTDRAPRRAGRGPWCRRARAGGRSRSPGPPGRRSCRGPGSSPAPAGPGRARRPWR